MPGKDRAMPSVIGTKEDTRVPKVQYSPEELRYRTSLIERMTEAQKNRDNQHDEFDGMTYLEYYETNSRAANSYIPPKRNDEDVRIVTGTTQEKEETLISAMLNLNLEPNVKPFDQESDEMRELGEAMELGIRKSRRIERPTYNAKRPLIYKELFDQGNVHVKEAWVEWYEIQKELAKDMDWGDAVTDLKKTWIEKPPKMRSQAEVVVLSGPNVYPGNIKEFFIDKQPFMFAREYISYAEAYRRYGKWARWKHVPKKIDNFGGEPTEVEYRDWTLLKQQEGFVEVLCYESLPDNELQIMLNGVMMLPIRFPLTAVSPSGKYTIAKGDAIPISPFFYYSKSIPSKTKVDQQVLDELYKLMIIKTRKSVKPPYANNTGDIISAKIFMPGTITDDIDANKLVEIGENKGVTQAEFNMAQFIKQQIDQKSVSPVFEGQSAPGKQTATEIVELKKQNMAKLGLTIWGVTNLEEQLSWLRLHNLLENWTRPVDTKFDELKKSIVNVYRTVTVEDTLENGEEGIKILEFTDDDFYDDESERIAAEERIMGRRLNKPVRKYRLHAKHIRQTELLFDVVITPTEKDTDAIDRAMFEESFGKALKIFPEELNMDYFKAEFARHAKWDKDKAFIEPQPMPTPGMPGAPGQPGQGPQVPPQPGQGQVGQALNQAVQGAGQPAPQRPSLNTLAQR